MGKDSLSRELENHTIKLLIIQVLLIFQVIFILALKSMSLYVKGRWVTLDSKRLNDNLSHIAGNKNSDRNSK